MSTGTHSCREEDPVSEAARVMQAAQIRRLPVVDDDGQLRGILSLADLAEASARLCAAGRGVSELELAQTLEAICRPRSEVHTTK